MEILPAREARILLPEGLVLGDLSCPPGTPAVVVFANGRGCGRHCLEDRAVARALAERGIGSLMLDLLTPPEQQERPHPGQHGAVLPRLTQRLLEAVQASWWRLLDRLSVPEFAAGSVVIRFRLHPDGTVTDATIVSSTVPALAALACKDAVTLPAPFDPWRPEMAALLGGEEWVTITFHYL